MSDNFENYIKNNLDEFDSVESPDVDEFWNEFQDEPGQKKIVRLWPVLVIAASIILLIGLFFFNPNKPTTDTAQWAIQNLKQNDPHLADYQAMLVSTMYQQDSLIKSLNVSPTEHQDIYQSLADLEEMEKEYMADLALDGSNEKIILALFKCAKQRIRLYELILYQLELKDYHEKLEHKIEI